MHEWALMTILYIRLHTENVGGAQYEEPSWAYCSCVTYKTNGQSLLVQICFGNGSVLKKVDLCMSNKTTESSFNL